MRACLICLRLCLHLQCPRLYFSSPTRPASTSSSPLLLTIPPLLPLLHLEGGSGLGLEGIQKLLAGEASTTVKLDLERPHNGKFSCAVQRLPISRKVSSRHSLAASRACHRLRGILWVALDRPSLAMSCVVACEGFQILDCLGSEANLEPL